MATIDFDTPAFVGQRAQRLSDLIVDQGSAALGAHGILTDPKCVSINLMLQRRGPMTLTELARQLDQPHQVVAQRLELQKRLGLYTRRKDPSDGRRMVLKLTNLGEQDVARLEAFLTEVSAAFTSVFKEIGMDADTAISQMIAALEKRSVLERIADRSAQEVRASSNDK